MIFSHSLLMQLESSLDSSDFQAFSQNRKMTIRTLDPKYQKVIGNRYGISFFDIKLINMMYDCNSKC